jgi:predicted RNase H-like HicB family nuclease
MKAWKVRVQIQPWPEGGYVAEAPALQGCWVVADTPEQALADIREGVEMSIASRLKRNEPLPADVEELEGSGESVLELDLAVALP